MLSFHKLPDAECFQCTGKNDPILSSRSCKMRLQLLQVYKTADKLFMTEMCESAAPSQTFNRHAQPGHKDDMNVLAKFCKHFYKDRFYCYRSYSVDKYFFPDNFSCTLLVPNFHRNKQRAILKNITVYNTGKYSKRHFSTVLTYMRFQNRGGLKNIFCYNTPFYFQVRPLKAIYITTIYCIGKISK